MSQTALRVRALRFLARREHSRQELRRKLSADDVGPRELEALLDEFEAKGWLSERRLAEQMVTSARGRYGSRHVLNRLQQKGLAHEALDQAAAALKQQELESAQAVWRKRFGRAPANLQEKAKQARFLAGRGFAAETIRAVLGPDSEAD